MRASSTLVACALFILLLAGGSSARADVFGPIELVSASAPAGALHQQADEAIFPVISANGRYVAFAGSFAGVQGIWRRDLLTGAVEQVAPGDATMPSISADGRYVSFTTTERLAAGDTNQSPDVYVRDMEPAEGEPQYTLVSAVNGSDEGAQYTFAGKTGLEEQYGSLAAARSAISADGRYVVFVTTAESNLLGGVEPTPALEVLVRDLATKETRLVSAEYNALAGRPGNGEDRPVEPRTEASQEYGAVFAGSEGAPLFEQLRAQNAWVGATISADGSTVAWMGQDLEQQTELLAGEQAKQEPELAEPLWRRISEGPAAPIRRITGGSDPLSARCATSGERESQTSPLDPCAGPFEHYREEPEGLWGKVRADFVPQLSADGTTVAFVTGARELASGAVQFAGAEATDDLYIVNMAGGLTRVQALRRITAIGGGAGAEEQLEKSSKILDYSVSPDGSQVAFTTQRTQFPLGSPAYVSAPAAAPGMIELYDVDLDNDTLTRVTHGFEGEDRRSEELPVAESPGVDPYHNEQGAYAPSFSEDGNTLSFASTANNLVYGDGNDAPDAFIVHRVLPTFATVTQYISSPPANPAIAPPWKLAVRAFSLANGRVLLDAEVPGAGNLAADASAAVRVRVGARHTTRGRARHTTRGRARHAASGRAPRPTVTVASRRVAYAKTPARASNDGLVSLTLELAPAYRSLAGGEGLSASIGVTFTAPGHHALHVSLSARFLRARGKTKPKSRPAHRRRTRARKSR